MLQYKMKMLRSSEMQSNPRRSTFSLVSECIKSGQELVPARRGKQTGDLKQVCDQCNMTTMPQERICTESQNHFTEVASSGETHLKTKGSTLETESNDFLGFAPILGNKEDPVKVNNQPDQLIAQINKIDERKTPSPVSSDQNQDHVHSRCFSGINRHLFIYKSFYFFFFSSVGALFPYLAVFYKQLWLTAHETGILMGIRPLIQLIGTPMWGVIADTYNRSKLIFLVSLSAWLVSNYSLSLVSPVLHLSVCRDNATIGIIEEILEILKNKTPPVKNSTDNIRQEHKGPVAVNTGKGSEGSEHWFELVGQLNHSNKRTWKIVSHKSKRQTQEESFRFITVLENFFHNRRNGSTFIGESSLNFDETSHSIYRKKVLQNIKFPPDNKHKRGRSSEVKINELLRHSMNSFRGLYSNGDKSVSDRKIRRSKDNNRVLVSESELLQILNVTQLGNIDIEELSNQVKSEDIERMFDWLSLAGKYPWPLDTIADYQLTRKSYDWQSQHDTHLFTILFFITAVGTLIAAPAITLADTATLQNLDRPEAYGKQRLWGALGWGLAAFIIGSSLSTIEELNNCNNPLSVNYMPCFYAFACLMGLALLNGALFEFDDKKSQESDIWQGLCILIDCQYVCFIVTILFCGTALGFIQTFLYWHLQDIGGSQFLFSTITAIHCISEVIVYSCSGVLIKWFGHHQMLYVGLSCYIIRFFAYAFITNSWAVLPFEILHGLSTAAVWSAAVVFVGLIPGAPATMQGILGGVHWGLGNGGGGVVGGLLITYAGTSMSFLLFGVVSLLGLTLFVCLNNMNYFTCFHWSKEDGTRSQYIPQDDEVNVDNETDYDDLY